MAEVLGGVYRQTSTPHKSGTKMTEKKKKTNGTILLAEMRTCHRSEHFSVL